MGVGLVVPAAGRGERLGHAEEKALVPLGGRPLLAWTLAAFDRIEAITERVVLTPPGRMDAFRDRVDAAVTLRHPVIYREGGAERQDSVARGLAALGREIDRVLVHDAARPLVTGALIDRILAGLASSRAVIPAVPPRDSMARRGDGAEVSGYLERDRLLVVQTPQGFVREGLAAAHARARDTGLRGTDDASLVLEAGETVTWVEGEPRNLKLTYPEDFRWAEGLLEETV